jgi:2-polyprenyl-6-methoxyphenol hydroxylase-like FAD-dependent oxidoreductase
MSQEALNIAVIGAGMGGLTATIALRRAGHNATCYEQTPALQEVGGGLNVTPNATRLLHRLGFDVPKMDEWGVRQGALIWKRWSGKVIAKYRTTPDFLEKFGAHIYAFHRAKLQQMLASALPSSSLLLGKRYVGYEQELGSDQVVVEFADGSTVAADMVVAADGLRSPVRLDFETKLLERQMMDLSFSADEGPRFHHKHAARTLIPADHPAARCSSEGKNQIYWLGGGKFIMAFPVTPDLITAVATIPADSESLESWTGDGTSPRQNILAEFEDWDPELNTLLEASESWLVLPLYDRRPLQRWTDGRLTLLGDAAHAMTPFLANGAGQAIEDAWVLAQVVRGVQKSGVPDALRRYEMTRRARAALVQDRSLANQQRLEMPDGPAQKKRDASIAAEQADYYKWLHGYDADSNDLWNKGASAK